MPVQNEAATGGDLTSKSARAESDDNVEGWENDSSSKIGVFSSPEQDEELEKTIEQLSHNHFSGEGGGGVKRVWGRIVDSIKMFKIYLHDCKLPDRLDNDVAMNTLNIRVN
uniref:Uncharacterized protein n=1 Tax=Magallana gigas TaxID=29159 RepID=K1RRT7_MAGGI